MLDLQPVQHIRNIIDVYRVYNRIRNDENICNTVTVLLSKSLQKAQPNKICKFTTSKIKCHAICQSKSALQKATGSITNDNTSESLTNYSEVIISIIIGDKVI